jgi:hypothetical protein
MNEEFFSDMCRPETGRQQNSVEASKHTDKRFVAGGNYMTRLLNKVLKKIKQ